jgi:hypothetical protein
MVFAIGFEWMVRRSVSRGSHRPMGSELGQRGDESE